MKKYEQYTADDRVEATLFDNDIHYLNGELDHENMNFFVGAIFFGRREKKKKDRVVAIDFFQKS